MENTELNSIISFDVNLAEVEAPRPLPAGQYDAVIQTAEIVKTKNAEDPKDMIKVSLMISADQYPADYTDGNPNGTVLTHFVMADRSVRSMFALKRFLLAVGAPLSNSIDTTTLIGLPAKVEVENTLWQGMETARIARVIA
jgi:hypothetical protein